MCNNEHSRHVNQKIFEGTLNLSSTCHHQHINYCYLCCCCCSASIKLSRHPTRFEITQLTALHDSDYLVV